MAAVRGLLSHPQQNKIMASSDYPEWMTAEHKTGVSKISSYCFYVRRLLKMVLICHSFADDYHGSRIQWRRGDRR